MALIGVTRRHCQLTDGHCATPSDASRPPAGEEEEEEEEEEERKKKKRKRRRKRRSGRRRRRKTDWEQELQAFNRGVEGLKK